MLREDQLEQSDTGSRHRMASAYACSTRSECPEPQRWANNTSSIHGTNERRDAETQHAELMRKHQSRGMQLGIASLALATSLPALCLKERQAASKAQVRTPPPRQVAPKA